MLELQKYLLDGKTLQDIKQDFNIEVTVDSELPLVLFNYTNFSPLHIPMVQESRGLILENESWNVVCKSLNAFFYYGEPNAFSVQRNFDWNQARASIKYDGALLFVYYYQNSWHIGCRIHPTANILAGSVNFSNHSRTFADVFRSILLDVYHLTWEQFTSKLIPGYSYSFEVFDEDLRVGILYDKPYIQLLCVVDSNLEEISIDDIDIGVDKPLYLIVNSIEEAFNYLNTLEEIHEGIVLCDSNFKRLKMRTMSYDTSVIPKAQQRSITAQSTASNKEAIDFLSLYAPEFFMLDVGSPSTGTDGTGGTTFTKTVITISSTTAMSSIGEPQIMSIHKPVISVISLMNDLNEIYQANKDLDDTAFNYIAESTPWKSALLAMRQGKSMIEYIDSASANEVYEAVQKYQQSVVEKGNQLPTQKK